MPLTASAERQRLREAVFRSESELQALFQPSDLFPGSVQARFLGMDRADDRQIWAYAQSEAVTIVTHDADFAELAGLYGPPPKVIWLRSGNLPTDAVAAWLRRFAPEIVAFGQDELAACLELV